MQLELSGIKYKLSMFPGDLFPIGFDFQALVRPLLLIRRFPFHCDDEERRTVHSPWFYLEHEQGISGLIIPFSA